MTDTNLPAMVPSIAVLTLIFMVGPGPQLPALAHQIPAAPTLVYVDHFNADIARWSSSTAEIRWSARDATEDLGRRDSGSIRVAGLVYVGTNTYTGIATVCSTHVEPGAAYQLRAHVYYEGDPATASRDYQSVEIELAFYRNDACEHFPTGGGSSGEVTPLRYWREARTPVAVAPSDARSVGIAIYVNGFPENAAFVDNLTLEAGVANLPSATAWIESPELEGFRFQVQIVSSSGTVRAATEVPDCLAETVCFGGALPDRAEVQVRLLGPRPNGYLWPVVTLLTPSEVRLWIEKTDTSERRFYRLEAAALGSDILSGFFDRRGFLPAAAASDSKTDSAAFPRGASPRGGPSRFGPTRTRPQ